MKSQVKVIIFTFIVLFLTVTSTAAGSRYYGSGYRHHGYSHNYYRHGGHHYSSGDLWAYLGVGLLTGVIITSIVNSQPRQPKVVYHSTPQVYVRPGPAASSDRVYSTYREPEYILRQVETTAQLLNIRATPDSNATVRGQLQRGTLLDVIGAAPEWLYIKTISGQYGWVMQQYTRAANEPVG